MMRVRKGVMMTREKSHIPQVVTLQNIVSESIIKNVAEKRFRSLKSIPFVLLSSNMIFLK